MRENRSVEPILQLQMVLYQPIRPDDRLLYRKVGVLVTFFVPVAKSTHLRLTAAVLTQTTDDCLDLADVGGVVAAAAILLAPRGGHAGALGLVVTLSLKGSLRINLSLLCVSESFHGGHSADSLSRVIVSARGLIIPLQFRNSLLQLLLIVVPQFHYFLLQDGLEVPLQLPLKYHQVLLFAPFNRTDLIPELSLQP